MAWYNKLNPFNTYSNEKAAAMELEKLAKDYFGEFGIYRDDTYEQNMQDDYNPDDMGPEIYEKMLQDGQVNSALAMIKLTLLAKGYEVIGNDDETNAYAEFITKNFESIDGHMDNALSEMLSAIEYGYSCTEKVFEYKDGSIMLKKLKVLDPKTVRIRTDRYGDMQFVRQYVGGKEIKIKPEKVIWWAYDKRFGNPYGQSELRRVYKHYFIRDKMYRFANIAYERYGTPLLVGQTQEAKDVPKMKALLRTINGLTGLAVSGGDEIKAIQGTPADYTAYIDHHGQQIMTTLLVPPMLLNLGAGQGGSYSLTENQMNVFIYRIQSLQKQLAALIEEELIRPLIDLNFPNAKAYPAFSFKPMVDKDMSSIAAVLVQLIQGQVIEPDEEWIREKLGFPQASLEVEKRREERAEAAKQIREGLALPPKGDGSNADPKLDPTQGAKDEEAKK